jgi:hypothetical protein
MTATNMLRNGHSAWRYVANSLPAEQDLGTLALVIVGQ